MQEIRLETRDGGYVVTGLIPPFQTWPEVVMWGERLFRLQAPHAGMVKWKLKEGEVPVYQEVFFVAVVQTKEGV